MRNRGSTSFALAGVLMLFMGWMAPTPVLADIETVVTGAELDDAMAVRADEDAASREAILNVLGRDEIRGVAEVMGVDAIRVNASVALLSGEELQSVAAQARHVDEALSGGGGTVVIGTTAIIIALLVIIILVAA